MKTTLDQFLSFDGKLPPENTDDDLWIGGCPSQSNG
jgi:hypothetical protein